MTAFHRPCSQPKFAFLRRIGLHSPTLTYRNGSDRLSTFRRHAFRSPQTSPVSSSYRSTQGWHPPADQDCTRRSTTTLWPTANNLDLLHISAKGRPKPGVLANLLPQHDEHNPPYPFQLNDLHSRRAFTHTVVRLDGAQQNGILQVRGVDLSLELCSPDEKTKGNSMV